MTVWKDDIYLELLLSRQEKMLPVNVFGKR